MNVVFVACLFFIGKSTVADPRIVGGVEAALGQFPYQVSIRVKANDFHFCGGSVIDERHVLTASHCVFEETNKDEFKVIEANKVAIGAGGIDVKLLKNWDVKYIFTHEDYKPGTADSPGDIAVIRIEGTFTYSENLMNIDLTAVDIPTGTSCDISGWGTIKSGGPTPKNLLYTDVLMSDKSSCARVYKILGINIQSKMICAAKLGHDSCQGDSGGPMVCDKKLTGVVSFGAGCASPLYPGVYTQVSSYLDWIKTSTKRSGAYNITSNPFIILLIATIFYNTC